LLILAESVHRIRFKARWIRFAVASSSTSKEVEYTVIYSASVAEISLSVLLKESRRRSEGLIALHYLTPTIVVLRRLTRLPILTLVVSEVVGLHVTVREVRSITLLPTLSVDRVLVSLTRGRGRVLTYLLTRVVRSPRTVVTDPTGIVTATSLTTGSRTTRTCGGSRAITSSGTTGWHCRGTGLPLKERRE
jgi:hypothetical protein